MRRAGGLLEVGDGRERDVTAAIRAQEGALEIAGPLVLLIGRLHSHVGLDAAAKAFTGVVPPVSISVIALISAGVTPSSTAMAMSIST